MLLAPSAEALELIARGAIGRLDLNRHLCVSKDEVDLDARSGSPIRHREPAPLRSIGGVGPELHEDEVLERGAEVTRPWCQWPAAGELIHEPYVEKIEPGCLNHPAFGPLRPGRHPRGNERIDEDVEIAADGVGGDADLPGDCGGVDDLAIRQRGGFKEPLEGWKVAGERLGKNLLPKIVSDVGLEP